MKPILITALLCSFVAVSAAQAADPPLATIDRLDVPRYMGTWYEIAKYPNWFQRKCVSDTRAQYSLQPDGTVQVVNRCKQASGSVDEAIGEARQVGPAKLEVRFAPAWLSFIPMVWGEYWVIDIDDAYRWVLVSEPGRKYLWILARSPRLDASTTEMLFGKLRQKGFDPAALEMTRQGN